MRCLRTSVCTLVVCVVAYMHKCVHAFLRVCMYMHTSASMRPYPRMNACVHARACAGVVGLERRLLSSNRRP